MGVMYYNKRGERGRANQESVQEKGGCGGKGWMGWEQDDGVGGWGCSLEGGIRLGLALGGKLLKGAASVLREERPRCPGVES